MNWLLRVSLILLTLATSFVAKAETSISWQNINDQIYQDNKFHNGAFIVPNNEVLLISTGIISETPQLIAEALNSQLSEAQSQEIMVFKPDTKNSAINFQRSKSKQHLAFSATVEHPLGAIVIGGSNGKTSTDRVKLVAWDPQQQTLSSFSLPPLPMAASTPSAVIVEDKLYVVTGSDAENSFYRLNLSNIKTDELGQISATSAVVQFDTEIVPAWEKLPSLPFNGATNSHRNGVKLVVQNNGTGQKIYALGGYSLSSEPTVSNSKNTVVINTATRYLSYYQDIWQFNPNNLNDQQGWQHNGVINSGGKPLTSAIDSIVPLGQSHLLAFTSDKQTLSYNVITKSWANYQQSLVTDTLTQSHYNPNFRTLQTTWFNDKLFTLTQQKMPTANNQIWQVNVNPTVLHFGWQNMTVLVIYLILVVMVGLFFMFKNKNTDDYFRGGQSIPWWAAACSIYATMLSSLTYVALPAIVYQTNWLLLIGIWMIIAVAPIAIYIAMPFFRQIDATSAYEYLSKRFNMSVRLFASGLFSLFHIGRMGIVMALTALALSAVTPLSASDSVLIMGVLCLIYCTMGGIEAVIWTDTLQTIVLLIGAVICFITIIMGIDGGITQFVSIGLSDDKFTMINSDFSLGSFTTLSIWVIVLGGLGQNISSYTADQAIVQRYMVTTDVAAARKSIWANAALAVPGGMLFFFIGSGLYAFYQLHPEKLDPTIRIDQIFPTFIATELPVGLAGLIVAGIFAAAQSTVSTSMNSIATTIVTDFIRPFNLIKTEKGFMSAARWLTFIMGVLGTLAGLIFIDPEIRSLMEAYFKVIGMFMGALGGLFVLGVSSKRANAPGAIVGITAGVITMISAWQMGWANGYLYATIGIFSCLIFGYLASLVFSQSKKDLDGLTLYTMRTLNGDAS